MGTGATPALCKLQGSASSHAGFLSLGTVEVWGLIIIRGRGGDCSVWCQLPGSISGLCALDGIGCVCAQLCLPPCDPMDCSPPDSSVHGIVQARILKWDAVSSSKRSSWPRDKTYISCIHCIGRQILYHWATWEARWQWHPLNHDKPKMSPDSPLFPVTLLILSGSCPYTSLG